MLLPLIFKFITWKMLIDQDNSCMKEHVLGKSVCFKIISNNDIY